MIKKLNDYFFVIEDEITEEEQADINFYYNCIVIMVLITLITAIAVRF